MSEEGSPARKVFDILDVIFNVIFLIELLCNMTANWFQAFFLCGWNFFDLFVVTFSFASIFVSNVDGIGHVRLIRVLRVMKLFSKMQSLKVILQSMFNATILVANAFVVLLIFSTLYAILVIMLFKDDPESGDLFGDFMKSMITMIQITSGDGWITDVVRPLSSVNQTSHDFWVHLFFVSYYLITNVVVLNIVVAVLLDEFVQTTQEVKEQKAAGLLDSFKTFHALDPLLTKLVHFKTESDLKACIKDLYRMFDEDENGLVGCSEMTEGLRKLSFKECAPMVLSGDEFQALAAAERKETKSRAHAVQEDVESGESREMSESPVDRADKDVELTFEQFDEMVREQVCVFVSTKALWHLCLRCVVAAVHLVEWKR